MLNTYQKKSLKNFYLTNKYASDKIDTHRTQLLNVHQLNTNISKLKILYITTLMKNIMADYFIILVNQ